MYACRPRVWRFYPPSLDFLKKTSLAKRGQNSLTSSYGSIKIRPNGGLYDGVDISTVFNREKLEEITRKQEQLSEDHFQDVGRIETKIANLDKSKYPLTENIKNLDRNLVADRDSYNVRFRKEPYSI